MRGRGHRPGRELGVRFDRVVHCSGTGSTQAGLLAGFAALGVDTKVTGISEDAEREAKCELVLRMANATLDTLGLPQRVADTQVDIVVADDSPYGVASQPILEAIRILAGTEGLIADPVYEGRTLRGLMDLVSGGAFRAGERVLVRHLGGTPAVHGYANQLSHDALAPLPFATNETRGSDASRAASAGRNCTRSAPGCIAMSPLDRPTDDAEAFSEVSPPQCDGGKS